MNSTFLIALFSSVRKGAPHEITNISYLRRTSSTRVTCMCFVNYLSNAQTQIIFNKNYLHTCQRGISYELPQRLMSLLAIESVHGMIIVSTCAYPLQLFENDSQHVRWVDDYFYTILVNLNQYTLRITLHKSISAILIINNWRIFSKNG